MDKDLILGAISEREFLCSVVELAKLRGWLVHHVLEQRVYARRIGPGFPDLVMVSPDHRRIIFAELKSERGKLREEQKAWLEALTEMADLSGGHVEVHIWRPRDWKEIENALL